MAVAGEWWERGRDRWLAWLVAKPTRARTLLALNAIAVAVVIATCMRIDRFSRGVSVWLACALMLLAWLLLAPTKTLRWASVFRLFSVATVWALVIAALCRQLADDIGLPVRSAGPSIAIAAVMEESLKLVPLGVIAFLAPGRARRFAASDWALLGIACGMGFQAAEDFIRQVALRPSIFSLLFGEGWRYGWTLFGGRFDADGVASYAGHHIETTLVATAIGLAARLGHRNAPRWQRALWALPPVLWLIAVADHAALNATVADRAAFTSGRSTVPTFLHAVWSWTGHGFNRGWLLIGLVAAAVLADARAQTGELTSRAVVRVMSRSWDAASRAWAAVPSTARVRAANTLAALAAERRRRELAAPPFSAAPPLLSTRVVAGLVATSSVGLSVLLSRSMAVRIGPTLRPSGRAWFAGLLDALGDWWDGLGPGGQALVVGAGLALIVLGALLLLPEVVIATGGLIVTEGGLIVVGQAAGGAGTAAVPAILAGAGILTMAEAASNAAAGKDAAGSSSQDERPAPRRDTPRPSSEPNFEDPTTPPGGGWEWRGKGSPGSEDGSWYNPGTGESLHPDLRHPDPIGPHYDFRAPDGSKWRVFRDGRILPK